MRQGRVLVLFRRALGLDVVLVFVAEVKCSECGNPRGHNAYCSQNPRYPTPPPTPTRKDKQHPAKRDDDGRKKR